MRRNVDDDLRRLERLASIGDIDALGRYMVARTRAGEQGLPPFMVELGRRALREKDEDKRTALVGELRRLRELADLPLLVSLDEMLSGYLGAALWSSMDNSDPETGGEPLDANYDANDFAPEAVDEAKVDIELFALLNDADLHAASSDDSQHGHDLWLTRNGHGVGFWDRDYGEVGDRLTDAAQQLDETNAYVGYDGRIYFGG